MELKQRLDPKVVFTGLYVILFLIYVVIGLQPADAVQYAISGRLDIPSIDLSSGVTDVELENGDLNTPDKIVGNYSTANSKTFLFGHSTTVFQNLNKIKLGDEISYDDKVYEVVDVTVQEKSDISMSKLLAKEDSESIVLMTCAGDLYDDGDASHRLIVTAVLK